MSAVPYRKTFFRLLGFLRPYRLGVIISILLAVGSQAAAVALIWVTGRDVIDNALFNHDTHALWIDVLTILGLGLVRAGCMLGRRILSGRQALDVEMDMRSGLYAHLVRLSFGFYDRHQTGQLMSRATVDLQGVRFFLGYGLIFFFQNVLTVLSVTVVLFFVQWELALIPLATTPLLVALAYRYSHVAHPTLRDVQQRLADVATVAEENIVGVHVVKAFAQEPAEEEKFRNRSELVFQQTLRANRQRATYVPLISVVPLLAQAAVLLVGARMVTDHTLTAGKLRRRSTSTSRCSSSRCARSACGSASRSAPRRRASGSSRSSTSPRRSPIVPEPGRFPPAPATSGSRSSRSSTRPAGRCCTASTSTSPPGRRSR